MHRPVDYARSGDVNIAYQVTGGGPLDLVLVSGFVSHLDSDWAHPASARFLERLSAFARLIRFDKRGTGLSDRSVGLPDLETRMDDVRAVMEAVGSERAALFGYSEGGPMSILFAATYPERVSRLILYGTYAKRADPDEDYPWCQPFAERVAYAERVEREWGEEADLASMLPGADPSMRAWWKTRARASASPAAARDLILMNSQIDVRSALGTVQAPTLVLHRRDDPDPRVEEGRYIAERTPHARFVELPGNVHVPWHEPDQLLDEIEEFLTGVRRGPEPDRVLATVMFTDIVGSTEVAARVGDRRWRDLLDTHHMRVRAHLSRFVGREVDTAGDGFLATFDGPARAIRCAQAIVRDVRGLGLDIRAGVHTGEIELMGQGIGGIAVHIGARIASLAGPGEVLVSSTVKDLVAGSGLVFEDRGTHDLKGVPGIWRTFAAVAEA